MMQFIKPIISNLKSRKYFWIKLLLSIFIITCLIASANIDILASIALIKKPGFFLLSVTIPLAINPTISSNRWKILLKVQGINERFVSLAKINFISIFLGILLPSSTGYDAVRMYLIEKRHNQKHGAGAASVIVERLLGFYLLSFLGFIGAMIAYHSGVPLIVLLIALLVNLLILVVFLGIGNKYLFSKSICLFQKVIVGKKFFSYLSSIYTALHIFPLRKVLLSTIPLILLFQALNIACAYLIFLGFGINIPFYCHLAFMPLIQIISIIPASISGFGLREGGFIYFYSILGVSSNISFLISLIYYCILMVLPALVGMLLYLFSGNRFKTIKNEIIDCAK